MRASILTTSPSMRSARSYLRGRGTRRDQIVCEKPRRGCVTVVPRAQDSEVLSAMTATDQGLPSTRRRLLVSKPGKLRDVVKLVTEPMPGLSEGDVAVRMKYVGINGGHDTWQGLSKFIKGKSEEDYPLGAEGAGVVVAVADDVKNVQVGDAVAVNQAMYNDYAIVKSQRVFKVPEATPEVVAGALSGMFGCMVVDCAANIQPGQNFFVTAGAGAAGSFILQFAKRAGARVITTVGSSEKAQVAKELGADVVINYRAKDVSSALSAAVPEGLDWAVDGVGGNLQDIIISHLKPGATMLQIGYIAEYPHTGAEDAMEREARPKNSETFWKGMEVDLGEGKTLSANVWSKDYSKIIECKQKCLELMQSGEIKGLVDDKEFRSLESVLDAIDYMLSGKAIGKVVVSL